MNVALLSEVMQEVKEEDGIMYLDILKKAQTLIKEVSKVKDEECEKRIREVHPRSNAAIVPPPVGIPGKNGLWESTLDMHYTAQAIGLTNKYKSAFLSEPGYCFRTVMGSTVSYNIYIYIYISP